jgi:transcription elongation factor GreA
LRSNPGDFQGGFTLVTPSNLSFSEALSRYVEAKKNGKKTMEGHQEIGRFIAWFGRERMVSELTPSEVADYAQYVGLRTADSTQRLNPVKGFLSFLKEEGWTETSLAPHLRVPRSRRTTLTRRTLKTSSPSAQLSQEGYQRLQDQLAMLKEERVKVVEDIKRAMADKDFRENAPLDAAKERQGIIESRIRELEAGLSGAQILSEDSGQEHHQQRITIGTKVALKEVDSGRQILYTLVDVREADVAAGKISTTSPVGQALLDRMVGEEVSVNAPKGIQRYLIEKIGA